VHLFLVFLVPLVICNYKFLVAQKMLYTPKPRNPLTSSRLSASAASDLGDNFSFSTLKNDLVALIYK
jgi:hypothetical protein